MTSSPQGPPRPPSLLRSVVPVTLFVLLAGIVGPIFLVMGLASDGPETGWLLPTGIGITALDLAIGVLVGTGRHRARQKTYRLRQRGRRARGEVLSFEQTNVRINDQPLVRLRISGDDIAAFEVEGQHVISDVRLPLLYAGELPVLVDPESREWEIDWDSVRTITPASSTGTPGAAYAPPGSVADTRTAGERLAELDELLGQDLISREEYDATRGRILGEI